ncbi:MAG: hypothetical protein TRG1_2777 [Flavobacteriaceae bacterium FS1-H7996/R]|nr:MAG: hypothetical protein TRG1_2777 [Flavobacteriaceae bacterium FS1-H7996/R]
MDLNLIRFKDGRVKHFEVQYMVPQVKKNNEENKIDSSINPIAVGTDW